MNGNDRGLVFFIGAIILAWLILDDFFGKKLISKFVDNVAGDADAALKDAIIDNIPIVGDVKDVIDDVKDAAKKPPTKLPDIKKPENMLPMVDEKGKETGKVVPGNYQTRADYYNKPFMPPPWSGYGPKPGFDPTKSGKK